MNQNDRELLELAAKAAGWTVVRWTDDDTALLLEGIQEPFNALHENPHSDCMGDALRLAVKLGILFLIDVQCGKVVKKTVVTDGKTKHEVNHDGDPCAATRRAIVRAAAEIAKAGGAV